MRKRAAFQYLSTALLLATWAPGLNAQTQPDSLQQALSGMTEREQVEYVEKHFAEIASGNFDAAIQTGEKALSLARKNRWPQWEAPLLKHIGIAYYLKGDYETCLPLYQQALDLYEKIGDDAGRGETLKEMGNYFKRLKRYDKALQQLEQSAALCAAALDTNCLTAALDIKAVVLIEQGRLKEAQEVLLQEQALLERNGNERALSYTLSNLADVAIGQKRFEEAAALLARSTEIRQGIGDATGVAINTNNTGEMYLRSGQAAKAKVYFEKTIEMSSAIGFTDLQRHAMQMLSETCSALGRHEDAIQWLNRSYALKDSIFNLEHSRQIAEIAEKYEAEKKEKELAQQQKQLQRRNFQLALTGAGLAILALASGFVFRQQRLKQLQLRREAELKTELVKSESALRLQRERLRISRDLHDNLGAELTIIGSSLARSVAHAPTDTEKKALEAIRNNARQAMSQLRETIWAIRYEQFSLSDLAEKVSDFATRAGAAPLAVSLPDNCDWRLSPSQTLNLFRIAQEAINNSLKYSGATGMSLVFELPSDNQLLMRISDNGCGFDPAQRANTGNGMGNMKIRAEELGGSLEIQSAAGEGTSVVVRAPFF